MKAIELAGTQAEQMIALRGVRVRARLGGMCQRTIVEQMFVNLEPRAIEAVYTFPLPENAAVCGFEVITSDRVLTGTIEENEKAIEKYDDAIDSGHGAFMVEADRPDVFTARVGNLKPKQSATIRLTYVAPLERVDKQIRVMFPTTVAPRYASTAGMDPLEGLIDSDALNPPKAWQVPYGLSLEVDVDLGKSIKAITSPTHAIRVTSSNGESMRVLLDGAMTAMDRDIVLNVDLAREHEPSAAVGVGPDGAPYLAVSFIPEFDVDELTTPPPGESIFVIDCSGSMQGQSIEQATRALELCLRSLSPGDSFNICRFGSTFEMMSSEPLVYSQQTLAGALQYIDRRADLGGTEILPALEAIFETRPRAGSVRNLIVLTDGQVSNEPAVIALARKHREHNRIFSFGIGSAASAFLVKGLARATRGASEFISGDERIEDKVLRTFSRIASPMVDQVEIDWGGADVQTLAEIPPVFDGDVMTVFGRVQGTPPPSVHLKCVAGGRPRSFSVQVPPQHDDGGVIATMWARRTIQSLEEVNDVRRLQHADKHNRERQRIIDLSKQFNLVSSLTTFIAIEHRSIEERNEGRPALRRVPVKLAAGWGGQSAGALLPSMATVSYCLAPAARRAAAGGFIEKIRQTLGRAMRRDVEIDRLMDASEDSPDDTAVGAPALRQASAPADDLQALLALQSADGWFAAQPALFSRLLPTLDAHQSVVLHSLERLTKHSQDQSRIIQTTIVLLILNKRFSDREALWRRAAQKAVRWIAQESGSKTREVSACLKGLESQLDS
jgi:Ca-activated chloride channel family protein